MNPTNAPWFLLSNHVTLAVNGPDATRLLQGQLTANLETLTPGQGQLAALCQPQGRVLSLFRLFHTPTGYALNFPAELLDITLSTLKKYAVFYKVSLTPHTSADMPVFVTTNTLEDAVRQQALAIAPCKSGLTYVLQDNTREHPHADGSLEHYADLLIQHGVPELDANTSGQFLPHDLNLIALGAVSLTKGCYTGQEIITRMQHRGTLKKHCHLATPPHRVHSGDPVFISDRTNPVGTLINATDSHVLMLVDDEAARTQPLLTQQQRPYHSLRQVPIL